CLAKVKETVLYLADAEDVYGAGDDLSAALRLRCLLVGYDLCFGDATETERQLVLDEVTRYLAVMVTDPTFRHGLYNPYCSNHGISIGAILGMADLCLAGEWPGSPLLADARRLGDRLIEKGLQELLGDDGSYGEGGLYLAWIYRMLIAYWEPALRLEGPSLWPVAKTEAALEWIAYQLLPRGNGYFLNRNDCSELTRPLSLHGTFWQWAQARLADPRFARWVQDRTTGDHGFSYSTVGDQVSVLLFHSPGEMLPPQGRLAPQRFFPRSGLYVYRNNWPGDPVTESCLFSFQAGTFRGGHWQEDVGQVTLHACGQGFAMDHGPGLQAKETEAHNLPLVGGLGQHNAGGGIGTDGTMTPLLVDGFCHALRADLAPAYTTHSPFNDPDYPLPGTSWEYGYDGGNPMERAKRWVLLLPRGGNAMPAIYLFDDLIKDGAPATMAWRLHFEATMSLAAGDGRYVISGDDGRLDARLLAPPPESTIWTLSDFTHDGPDDSTAVLAIRHSASRGCFLWQWLPRRADTADAATTVRRFPNGLRATVVEPDGLERDVFACWAKILPDLDAYLTGRFAVWEREGCVERAALVAGSEFWQGGRLLIRLSPPASASADEDTVRLSRPDLDFRILAPTAQAVLAEGMPVPFHREGDYLVDGAAPRQDAGPGAAAASGTAWRLDVSPLPGRAAWRLALAGPAGVPARVDIFDVRGRRLARLHEGPLAPGAELLWTGRDGAGRRLASGVYLARLSAPGACRTARLVLLR
ncbi:MAG: hypothetical protein JW819_14015, partial [Candidatus Krumholzibacteriota bacterium]|nr:hypothetical protein [Candidatus Krumholzibacteriota bacterium]